MHILIGLILFVVVFIGAIVIGNSITPKLGGRNHGFRRKLEPGYENILLKYSRYYRLLSDDFKKSYDDRIMQFVKNKEFVGKGKMQISDQVKVLVADSAIKLTFGLKTFLFEKFQNIIVFQGEFYSEFSRSYEKGETNPRGAIVFSWKDFLDGDLKDSDNINLGLHEFAHALMNQTIDSGRFDDEYFLSKIDFFLDFYNDKEKLEFIRKNELFRKYAFRNEMEFFAVAVEHFFETPVEFREKMPELFDVMCKLLNQDTALLYAIGDTSAKKIFFSKDGKESEETKAPNQPQQSI